MAKAAKSVGGETSSSTTSVYVGKLMVYIMVRLDAAVAIKVSVLSLNEVIRVILNTWIASWASIWLLPSRV
jgi:hypothetical protein